MMRRWRRISGLLLLVPVLLLAGCAATGTYQGPPYSNPSLNMVPPSFYGNDPTMSYWYTAPYFMPYEMP